MHRFVVERISEDKAEKQKNVVANEYDLRFACCGEKGFQELGSKRTSLDNARALLAVFGLRKCGVKSLELIKGQPRHERNRRQELLQTLKVLNERSNWFKDGFGGREIFADLSSDRAELISDINNESIEFYFLGDASKKSWKSSEDLLEHCTKLAPSDVEEMTSWILQDRIEDYVGKERRKFRCPLRRDLSYKVELYDRENLPEDFPRQVANSVEGDHVFLKSELYFLRGNGDLGDGFFVGFVHSNDDLDKLAAQENVIYREDMRSSIRSSSLLGDFGVEDPSPVKLKAFIGGQLAEQEVGGVVTPEDRTQLEMDGEPIKSEGDSATYIRFKIPREYQFKFEPILFSFILYTTRAINTRYIPFSLAEDTLGAKFQVHFGKTQTVADPRLLKFIRVMRGEGSPRASVLFPNHPSAVGLAFDAHSLPAGEGGVLLWNTIDQRETGLHSE